MAGLILRPALQDDHVALESLFRETAMGSSIRLGFERDPDYFAGAGVQADELCVWGAFDTGGRAVGLFSAGARKVWIGSETRMRYLADLRIHPDWQGSSLLARGFRLLRREVFLTGEWAQTLVLEGNRRALDLLTSRRVGLPVYHPAGRYATWMLPCQKVPAIPEIHVRQAVAADLAEMQRLYDDSARRRSFSPMVSFSDFGKPAWRDLACDGFIVAVRSGSIVGMMGLWDQGGFQRLRIHGYSRAVSAVRPLWNRFSNVRLPEPGQVLPCVKATAVACEGDDPRIMRAMLAFALSRLEHRFLLAGFSVEDPLCAAFAGLRARRDYGRHFLVGWEGEPPVWREPFAFDVARI